jgi:hypothetical protein
VETPPTGPTADQLLARDGTFLSRTHLRELGWSGVQVDAIFRKLPIVKIEGCRCPVIRASDYLELIEASTYGGDRVRPTS